MHAQFKMLFNKKCIENLKSTLSELQENDEHAVRKKRTFNLQALVRPLESILRQFKVLNSLLDSAEVNQTSILNSLDVLKLHLIRLVSMQEEKRRVYEDNKKIFMSRNHSLEKLKEAKQQLANENRTRKSTTNMLAGVIAVAPPVLFYIVYKRNISIEMNEAAIGLCILAAIVFLSDLTCKQGPRSIQDHVASSNDIDHNYDELVTFEEEIISANNDTLIAFIAEFRLYLLDKTQWTVARDLLDTLITDNEILITLIKDILKKM